MNGAPDIDLYRLIISYGLMIIPIGIALYFKVPLVKRMVLATIRMTGQLFLIGVVLIYLFDKNYVWLNILWVVLMVVVASFSAINNSELNYRKFFAPVFAAFLVGSGSILLFFNALVVDLENIFAAEVLVVLAGMLIGNALKSNIIGISHFYRALEQQEQRYLYHISLGAGQTEALIPFFRESMSAALKPSIASISTMGLVFLPGVMTGQILGGASPETAIKYQIAIVIAIFVSVAISVTLSIFFSINKSFNAFGVMQKDVFRRLPNKHGRQ